MNFVFLLLAVIFGTLFFVRHVQFRNLKTYSEKLENELTELRNQQAEGSSELNKSNIEYFQKPSDPLTGLPGRQAFDDRLQQAIYQSKRYQSSFAVMSVDINKFALVNNISYEFGDKILKEFAMRLHSSIRQVDSITRYAGNNFLILLPQLSKPETAAYVAQRIQDNMMQPFHADNQETVLTVSIGIVIYPIDGDNIKTLLQHLNKALEIAKTNGKNSYQFYHQEIHVLGERELILSSLVRAPNVCERLSVSYLPGISTRTNQIVRVQAVPYFMHPQLGEVCYADFVNIADNVGKNAEIGLWTLKNLISQVTAWQSLGMKLTQVAMQVTVKQLLDPFFIKSVIQLLTENKLGDVQILFEFVDSNLTNSNSLQLDQSILSLRTMGVYFVVGIHTLGHFALQKIHNVPISFLKINVALFRQTADQTNREELLHMIISLAKTSGIGVIIDGIETEQAKQELKSECDILQGKLFRELLPYSDVQHF